MLNEIAPDAAGICISRLDRVSKWLEKQVASRKLAGCSVLIGRKAESLIIATKEWPTSNTKSLLLETP